MFAKVCTAAFVQIALLAVCSAESTPKFAAPATAVAAQDLNSGGGVLQIFGSLALVVATILVIGWIARRMRAIPQGRGGHLKVVDEVTIGPKERAVIVQVDGMHLVLGVGEGRVSLLHRSPALLGRAESVGNAEQSSDRRETFFDILKRNLGK